MKLKLQRIAILGLALALIAIPTVSQACDACMGAKDPTLRPAVDGAIFFMLGMIGMMVTGIGFFMRYLVKRARMPMPAHVEFGGL